MQTRKMGFPSVAALMVAAVLVESGWVVWMASSVKVDVASYVESRVAASEEELSSADDDFDAGTGKAAASDKSDERLTLEQGKALLEECERGGDQAAGVEAFSAFAPLAASGDAEGQFCLGYCYYYGYGIARDYAKAYENFLLSARQGNARGEAWVGRCLYDGTGVVQDREASYQWYSAAARKGDPVGENGVGSCYKHGYGVECDYEQMIYWYRLSADAGYDNGQVNLGACYQEGLGVERNSSRAVELYELSAAQGNSLAQLYLAECYYEGDGVPRDVPRALEYAQEAADNTRDTRGNEDARSFLKEHVS